MISTSSKWPYRHLDYVFFSVFKNIVCLFNFLSGNVCVINVVVSIFFSSINFRISSQSHPSTPPVLKVRFFPYICGNGNTLIFFIKSHYCHYRIRTRHFPGQIKSIWLPPATSRTRSAPPWYAVLPHKGFLYLSHRIDYQHIWIMCCYKCNPLRIHLA